MTCKLLNYLVHVPLIYDLEIWHIALNFASFYFNHSKCENNFALIYILLNTMEHQKDFIPLF